ncbi:interleukin-1 receptor type 2 isoform X4 [Neoarius graeffei]|uniref:interleukin-1 receptor type 2 isoform X4 n=1 Tax=Neoarius graeffei TaxID=443677 RepID=UPI00298D5F22|nr:interleukin-1 receptor type 2 isoform X4 [Neoarius graeffei]
MIGDVATMTEVRVIICLLAELVMTSAAMNYSAQCENLSELQTIRVIQGEGLRQTCPNLDCSKETNNSFIFWFKNLSDGIQPITMEENERVHYHGSVLYFLPLSLNDTGHYITQRWYNASECEEFETKVVVYEKFHTDQLYRNFSEQTDILPLGCPVWQNKGENITWYKDFHLIPNNFDDKYQVHLRAEEAKGIYTCICTWEHHGHIYNTSGSFQVQRKVPSVRFPPTFQYPTNNSVMFVDLGEEVKLNCLVFFGTNIDNWGSVHWMKNRLILKSDERSFRIMQCKRHDGKVYDAYVIYQKDDTDEVTGRKVAYFVSKVLPAVLEDVCGFKLYIHGRDDLPGEDCTELIQMRMQQSRRLIAVLSPRFSQHQGVTNSLSYDWHVGLHQVLVEQDLRVILIQLGDMKEYSHLPLGLQHLLQKTPPLRWDEESGRATCPTSYFWKQVRYMMPVPPYSSSRGVYF